MVLKEKFSSWFGILSGSVSFLGGYQVCHNICLGIIAILSLFGIILTGMPLLLLQKVAVPCWIVAVILLVITLYFYFSKKCISPVLIILNMGILIGSTPFSYFQKYYKILWIIGGFFIITGIILFITNKIKK